MFTNQFAKRKSVVPTASLFELTSVLLEYTLALLRVHSDKTSDNINYLLNYNLQNYALNSLVNKKLINLIKQIKKISFLLIFFSLMKLY